MQTNDKAEALTEVESLRRKLGPVPTEDEMKMETQALQVSQPF